MNLKLAEYNIDTANTISLKPPKFQGFLELGKDFSYSGDFITLSSGWRIHKDPIMIENVGDLQKLFDGLFVGRTYSRRFVLIESKIISRFNNPLLMSQDDIFSYNEYTQKACEFINFHHWEETEEQVEMNPNFKILGNLHKNPELWEKVK